MKSSSSSGFCTTCGHPNGSHQSPQCNAKACRKRIKVCGATTHHLPFEPISNVGGWVVCRPCPEHGRESREGDFSIYPVIAKDEHGNLYIVEPGCDQEYDETADYDDLINIGEEQEEAESSTRDLVSFEEWEQQRKDNKGKGREESGEAEDPELSNLIPALKQMEIADFMAVETYASGKKICFINQKGKEVETERMDWQLVDDDENGPYYYWKSLKSGRSFTTWSLPEERKAKHKKKGRR